MQTSQVSPALSVINSIAQERLRLGDAYQGPQRVLLTWAARHKAEFTVLEASLMAICTCALAPPAALVEISACIALKLSCCNPGFVRQPSASLLAAGSAQQLRATVHREKDSWLDIRLHYTGKHLMSASSIRRADSQPRPHGFHIVSHALLT